jgi:phosphatidylinositol 3-kinase
MLHCVTQALTLGLFSLVQSRANFTKNIISAHSDMFVTARLWSDSKPLALQEQTAYKAFKNSRTWNEWLSFPVPYSECPLSTQVAITVWDLAPAGGPKTQFHAVPFGGTTIPLFDKDSTLQKGRIKCRIYRHNEADGYSQSTTPYAVASTTDKTNGAKLNDRNAERLAEMERLEELMKKYEMGEIPENKWLDQLAFRQLEKMEKGSLKAQVQLKHLEAQKAATSTKGEGAIDRNENNESEDGVFYLYIEFPRFDHPVVFTDHEYPAPPISTMQSSSGDVRLKPPPEVAFGPGIEIDRDPSGQPPPGRMIRIYDPEVGMRDNPAESKHRRLVRSHRTGVLDRDLKPNAKFRDELNVIMSYGPLQNLIDEEKDLVWKFRHHLTRDKRALTKFVKSVSWNDQAEAKQAVSMLAKWTTIDVDDALELLGPTFENQDVRAYAVDRLRKADDDELLLYLLQLVQALKFERPLADEDESSDFHESSLAKFLIARAADNFILGNYLHWYLMVECDDRTAQQDPESRRIFARVEYDFMSELEKRPDGKEHRKTLLRQAEFITQLSRISLDIRNSGGDRIRKIERFKKFLGDPKNEMTHFDPPLPLPLDPTVQIVGCFPDEANVFKSSLLPLFISFRTVGGQPYPIIFKTGDDLRQDQLVIQIITLMDRLLRKENLDLKLSPYRILATGPFAGAVQFIPSQSLSAILSKHKTLLNYLRHHSPDASAELGVRKEVMETYIKSCAGYCVITYLLGVGDRHSDNLLLAPSGHFFHADFGYILGRDPKPFAPLMKLDPAMVAGMGGPQHAYYAQFKQYCFTAYASLRKSANLILNLFALMSEANIPDIRIEPDKAVLKVQERFHLEMTEDEAMLSFESLIAESSTAVMPQVIDRLHGFVQGLRA